MFILASHSLVAAKSDVCFLVGAFVSSFVYKPVAIVDEADD